MSRREPRYPPRPAVPTALWCLVASWSTTRVIGWASMGVDGRSLALSGWVMSMASLVLMLRIVWAAIGTDQKGRSTASVVICVSLIAAGVSCFAFSRLVETREALCGSSAGSWLFEASGDPTTSPYGYRVRAQAIGRQGERGEVWLVSRMRIGRGERVRIVGRVAALEDDEYGRSMWAQGICASVRVIRVRSRRSPQGVTAVALRLRSGMIACYARCDPDASAVLSGCVCGEREQLDERGLSDAFATCGIAHMMAVSGAHLAALGGVVMSMLEQMGLRARTRLVLLLLVTGCYVMVCGAPISAIRAWAMIAAAGFGGIVGRRTHTASSVSVVALSMLLADPMAAGRLGYCLSVSSVIGLSLLSPHATYILRSVAPLPPLPSRSSYAARLRCTKAYEAVTRTWAATVVCQLVTLPFVAGAFGRVSLMAPVANLIASPLVHALMTMGFAAALLDGTPVALPILRACQVVSGLLVWWIRDLSETPLCTIRVPAASPLAMLPAIMLPVVWLVWWPRVSRRVLRGVASVAMLGFMLAYVHARYLAPARMVVLDVGQGDAILVQDGSHALLVDCGPDAAVALALQRQRVIHLDAVVLTHLHDDHCGGMDDLIGVVGCDAVVVARGVAEAMPDDLRATCQSLSSRPPREISYGDVLRIGGFRLRMVWPHGEVDGDENAESVELLLEYGEEGDTFSALLTGDAESDETGACVTCGDVGDIDVLKVGHHGSEVSIDDATARRLAPELSIASAGEGNSYGHPTAVCQGVLRRAGSRFLCTKDVGDVDVRPRRNGMLVCTYGTRVAL